MIGKLNFFRFPTLEDDTPWLACGPSACSLPQEVRLRDKSKNFQGHDVVFTRESGN